MLLTKTKRTVKQKSHHRKHRKRDVFALSFDCSTQNPSRSCVNMKWMTLSAAMLLCSVSSANAGLFDCFKKEASCCAPAPMCCEEPSCCAPAPKCCHVEPTCCAPAACAPANCAPACEPTCCAPAPKCCHVEPSCCAPTPSCVSVCEPTCAAPEKKCCLFGLLD